MITATNLRKGVAYVENGDPIKVLDYKHTHMSRGAGTVRVKVRNLKTGAITTKTYRGGDKVEDISVIKKPLQYLYNDGEEYFFMDPQTFEQIAITAEVLGDSAVFLKEGADVHVVFWDELALDIDLPPKLVFTIAEADPGEKGDSASNVYKDAVLENGLRVKVPLFIKVGEQVRIDTRSGEYIERA